MPLNLSDLNRLAKNDPKLSTLDFSQKSIDADDLNLLLTNLKDNTHLGRIKWPKDLPQDSKSQQHLQAIQKKLDQNNAEFTAHPSHYEHAVLSKHVYLPHSLGQAVRLEGSEYNIVHQLAGWEIAEVFDLNRENGLYAALYINPHAGHCVLAFRGTEIIPPELAPSSAQSETTPSPKSESKVDSPSYWERIQSWFADGVHQVKSTAEQTRTGSRDLLTDLNLIMGRITAQQVDAYQLVLQTAKYADEHGYRLSLTGHSLGGWLAQLMAIHLLWDCRLDPQSITRATCAHLEVITFDNPGVDAMVAALQPTVEISRKDWREMLDEFHKIATVYLTVPNPVNTAGRQFGKVYRLLTEVPDLNTLVVENLFQWAATPDTLKRWSGHLGVNFEAAGRWAVNKTLAALGIQTGLSHSMRYLLKAFDPLTGEAQHAKEVSNWPAVDWAAGKNPTKAWIKSARSKIRSSTGMNKKIPLPTFLLEHAENFIFNQVLGLLLNLFELPKEFKKLPGELSDIPGVIYLWCSGEANSAVLKEFLAFAQQFGAFDINQSEAVMPLNQTYYLQFKHKYRADPIDPLRCSLSVFSDEARALLDILEDLNELKPSDNPTTHLILGSYFADPAFTQLQQQFTIELSRVVAGRRYLDVRLQQRTLSQFTHQLFRLLQLYQADVPKGWTKYWEKHKAQRVQHEKTKGDGTFKIREQVWWNHPRALYRQHQFLVSLFADDQLQSIETAYINLMLLQEEEVQRSTPDDKTKTDGLSKSQDVREARLSSFEDVYTTKMPLQTTELFTQSTKKRYLVIGKAGIGKSTLLHYLTYQWAHGVWGQQFEWVFWIKLRNITPQRYPEGSLDWIDLLIRECFSEYTFNTAEKQHFKDMLVQFIAQSKVLWLLDGYDEVAGKMNQPEYAALKPAIEQLIQMPWLILTSRPEAVIHDRSFDQRLEIIGFTNTDIESYIIRYFEEDPESSQSLLHFLRRNPGVWGITHIPINLQLLCHSWQEQHLAADINLTQLYQGLVNRLLQRYAQKQSISLGDAHQLSLMTHPTLKPLIQKLAEIAFIGMERGQVVISVDSAKVKPLLALGLIKIVQQETPSVTTVEFIHLTFQEFLAGFYLAQLMINQDTRIESLVTQYKYDPHFEITWWFVAGLLVPHPEKLKLFFDYLLREPRDLTVFYEYGLLMRCLDESDKAEFSGKTTLWEGLRIFWRDMMASLESYSYQTLLDRLALSVVVAEKLAVLVIEKLDDQVWEVRREILKIVPVLLRARPALADALYKSFLKRLDDNHEVVIYEALQVLPSLLQAKPTLADVLFIPLLKNLNYKDNYEGYTYPYLVRLTVEALPTLLQANPALAEPLLTPFLKKLEYWHAGKDVQPVLFALLQAKPSLVDQMFLWTLEKLSNKNWWVTKEAMQTLPALLQTKPMLADQLITPLLEKLNDRNVYVSCGAMEALLSAKPMLADWLIQKLADEQNCAGQMVVNVTLPEFLKIKPQLADQILPWLIKSLEGKYDLGSKQGALEALLPALLQAKPELVDLVFMVLLKNLSDEHGYIGQAVIEATVVLLRVKPALNDQVFLWLIKKLSDEDWFIRLNTIKVLPAILQAKPRLIDPLFTPFLKSLSDGDSRTRASAVRVLSELLRVKPVWVDQMTTPFLEALDDKEDDRVRGAAVIAIPTLLQLRPALVDQILPQITQNIDKRLLYS